MLELVIMLVMRVIIYINIFLMLKTEWKDAGACNNVGHACNNVAPDTMPRFHCTHSERHEEII